MARESISEVLAANLAHFMREKDFTQQKLAKAAGVGQTTVSLYLNPDARQATATGRVASPKLEMVQKLAEALDVQPWELIRPLTPAERQALKAFEAAMSQGRAAATGAAGQPAVAREHMPRKRLSEKQRKLA